jgi:hypothetical protein
MPLKTLASLPAVLLLLALSASAATTVNSGTISVTLNINIASVNLRSKDISCNVIASVSDVNTSTFESRFATESASVLAAHTSGASTASCTVTIPYKWTLSSASTDKINIMYTITSPATFTTTGGGLPNRYSSQTVANPLVVGGIKTYTIAATI